MPRTNAELRHVLHHELPEQVRILRLKLAVLDAADQLSEEIDKRPALKAQLRQRAGLPA